MADAHVPIRGVVGGCAAGDVCPAAFGEPSRLLQNRRYSSDIVISEPGITPLYDDVLSRLDKALAE